MSINDLYKGIFDELNTLAGQVSSAATDLQQLGPQDEKIMGIANRLFTIAETANRLSVVRPT